MVNIVEQIKLRYKAKYVNDFKLEYAALAKRILSSNLSTEKYLDKITNLNLFERWVLFSEILKIISLKSFHFLHVPKTGGTTFGETLGQDKKALIVSLDAEPLTFLRQLFRLANAKPEDIVLSRAHHGLRLLIDTGCIDNFSLILTAYRDPLDIHISNANMIMRRLDDFFNDKTLSGSELKFCKYWSQVIGYQYENSSNFATKLINSQNYLEQMGEVYGRFFNIRNWKSYVKGKKIAVIPSTSFDNMFTDVFDYEYIPVRKNVSKEPILDKKMLTDETKKLLVGKDKAIVKYLSSNLVTPLSIKHYFK